MYRKKEQGAEVARNALANSKLFSAFLGSGHLVQPKMAEESEIWSLEEEMYVGKS